MRIEAIERAFAPDVRRRGADYDRARALVIRSSTATAIKALAFGTATYRVSLEVQETASSKRLALSCSCPFFVETGPCKHLWALGLAAEEQGLLAPLPDAPMEVAGPAADQAAGASTSTMFRNQPSLRAAAKEAKPRARPLPAWQKLLRSNARHHQAEPPPAAPPTTEILYVVDVDKTIEADDLVLALRTRTPKKKGGFGPLKRAAIPSDAVNQLADEHDRRALPLFQAAAALARDGGYWGYSPTRVPDQTSLPISLADELLARVDQSGRLFVHADGHGNLVPARWDGGRPWELALKFARRGAGAGTGGVLEGVLRRGDESVDLAAPLALTSTGWIVFRDSIGRVEHFGAAELADALREQSEQGRARLEVSAGEEAQLLDELLAMPALPRLDLPEDLALEEIRGAPQPALLVKPPSTKPGAVYWDGPRCDAELSFTYADAAPVGMIDPRAVIADVERRRLVRRDLAVEEAAARRLQQLGFTRSRDGYAERYTNRFDILETRLPVALRALLAAGWRVEAEGKLFRQPARMELSVASGVDWFDLTAEVDFGGGVSAKLPALLRALRDGARTVPLGDGSLGVLPEAWLRRYQALAGLGTTEGEALRFGKSQVGLLDALLASEPVVNADRVFQRARNELRRFEGVQPESAPATFRGELRPYQEAGLGWLAFLRRFGFGGCLADDMGLGKTVQVLALLAARAQEAAAGRERLPSLAVVPKSLVWNWRQEAARFAPDLRVLAHVGTPRPANAADFRQATAEVDLIVTTYGVLRKDAPFLREVDFDYVILDEAQAIKNAGSESAKAARLLRGRHRLALSGTPVENHLGELWSLIEFLNPGMLGSARALAELAGAKRPDPDTLALLGRALRPFILRRTKQQVAPELPPKQEETIFCEMESEQRRLYDELRAHYRASLLGAPARDGLARMKIQILEALLRLRQAACHPGLIDRARQDEGSGKLDVLMARLEEVRQEGHKALVFSQFTSFLGLVKKRLDAAKIPYEYLDGKTADREARVARFQTDAACPLFLISLKAGGVGLNLTAADYVFILDPWWNPAVEAQAVDRAHRIGQDKRVFVYRLLCRDSVEEKVAALQDKKRDLAAAVIDGADGSLLQKLDRETLELLLG